jgi:hypothetical protein
MSRNESFDKLEINRSKEAEEEIYTSIFKILNEVVSYL